MIVVVAGSKRISGYSVILQNGNVIVEGPNVSVTFKLKFWLLRVNPKLIFPGFRKDYCKKIFINGKVKGNAAFIQSCAPISKCRLEGGSFGIKIKNWIRERLGLLCNESERGWFRFKLNGEEYVVLQRVTERGNTLCEIYSKENDVSLGSFIIDSSFENIYPYFSENGFFELMLIVAGYMIDYLVNSCLISQLNGSLRVIL